MTGLREAARHLSHSASASSMLCVVSTTARSLRAARMTFHSSCRDAGSRPGGGRKAALLRPVTVAVLSRRLLGWEPLGGEAHCATRTQACSG